MYTKKKCKIYVLSVLLCTFFFSCSSIDFELPQGPQGTNGKSAYEIWKEEVETGHINWPSTQVDLADFLVYIKGEKGDKGKDGMSAYDQWKILITQGNVTNPHDPSLIWPSSKNTEADFLQDASSCKFSEKSALRDGLNKPWFCFSDSKFGQKKDRSPD